MPAGHAFNTSPVCDRVCLPPERPLPSTVGSVRSIHAGFTNHVGVHKVVHGCLSFSENGSQVRMCVYLLPQEIRARRKSDLGGF